MHLFHRFSRKAPRGAFFVACLFLLLAPFMPVRADVLPPSCQLQNSWKVESVQVEAVLDGDTVVLTDGRRVRLIGVNTPEIEHKPKPAEPLADQSHGQLAALVRKSPLYLQVGSQPKDHYGRTLGHLFTGDGRNIIAELLLQGAGFQVAIPPNLAHADCYAAAQGQARVRSAGVWGHPYYAAVAADSGKIRGGYQRVQGRVEKVTLTKKVVWVDLAGDLSLKLDRKNATHLAGPTFDRVIAASRAAGRKTDLVLEVRGWVVDRNPWGGRMRQQIESGQRKRFLLGVSHASQWEAQ